MDNINKTNYADIIAKLGAAIQRLSLYDLDHPIIEEAFREPYAYINQFLNNKNVLNIGLVEDGLVVEGIPLDSKNLLIQNFISLLKNNSLYGITLQKGLTEKELIKFGYIMNESDSRKEKTEELKIVLKSANIEHIKVNLVYYAKVTKDQKETIEQRRPPLTKITKESGRAEDLVIANYLMGKVSELKLDNDAFENELLTNPQHISKIIIKIAEGKDEYKELMKDASPSKIVIQCLKRINKYFLESMSMDWNSYKRNLVSLILSLNPELQRSLSTERKTVVDGLSEDNLLKSLILKFEDDVRIDIIVKEYLKHKKLSDDFIEFIKKIIPTQETLKELTSSLIKKLRKSGMASEDIDSLQTTLWQKVATQARILIAEDDENVRKVYKEELEDMGLKVMEAGSGKVALQKIHSGNPDLVVLDIKMPDGHGIQILEKMKSENIFIPVIICTAFEGMKEDFVVKTYPNLTYLVKPVSPQQLVQHIRKSLKKK